ncbi:MAG TPA: ABC transporter substrate-binding protein, partial [Kofleriaceae bacterium]|nr:ABC transporter substrate-binding protein [Kofleriaceae bacterium]
MKTITIAMAGLLGLAACGGDDDGGDPVELGVVAPLDGELAFFGRAFPDAISLAMTEINDAGGVAGGRALIQVTENDQTNPDVA